MAQKRMFSMKIVDSDAFLDMPLSAQCLYFHLNMRADDDGFVDNPKKVMRIINSSDDDLKILITKNFVICFDSGVLVIKHWRIHNTLSAGRYHPTTWLTEKGELLLKENASYSLTEGTPLNDKRLIETSSRQTPYNKNMIDEQKTSERRAKDEPRIDLDLDLDDIKERESQLNKKAFYLEKENDGTATRTQNFPTLGMIEDYKKQTNSPINAKRFYDYYTARNWQINGATVFNWKALFDSWRSYEKKDDGKGKPKRAIIGEEIERHEYSDEELNTFFTKLDEEGNKK